MEVGLNHNKAERSILKKVFAINLTQVALAGTIGFIANSMGLMGMALDNLADAGVYVVIIYAVGKSHKAKARTARLSGTLLIILGFALLVEIVRKFGGSSEPIGFAMIVTAIINSLSNLVCLYLLRSYRKKGAHMKASYIFTGNDMLINSGIVLSGILVMIFQSRLPDLFISVVLVGIGIKYGIKILNEANKEAKLQS